MKKSIFYLLFIILNVIKVTSLMAQKLDSTSTLAVVPFSMAFVKNDDDTDYPKILAERTLTAIEQSKRFNLVDRTDIKSLDGEFKFQGGDFRDDFKKLTTEQLAQLGKRLRADFLLTGTVSNVETTINPISGAYKAVIGFSIKVINVYSGKIYITESFEVNSGSVIKQFQSPGEAISAAFVNIDEPVKLFVDKYFPIYAKYIRTEKVAKLEMKEVLVNAGTDRGFRTKQKLDILIITGKTIGAIPPEDVGDAEVIAIQPEYATIRITSTKKNLEQMDNKEKVLYFRSKSN